MDAATENASNTAFEYSTESAESEGFFASELDERSFLDLQPVHAIVYIALTVVALSVGSVGNLLIVACFVVNKALRKVGNEFLLNMAFSDLCVTGLAEPMCVLVAIHGRAYFNSKPVLCQVTSVLCLTTCICAFLNLGAITFNRYIRICRPGLKHLFTRCSCVATCIAIWFVALVVELPNVIWRSGFFDTKSHQCIWRRTGNATFTFFVGLVLIAGPLLLMTCAYMAIFHRAKESKRKVFSHNVTTQGSNISHWREAVRSSRTLCLVLLMMILCWTPYTIVILIDFGDTLSMKVHLWVTYFAHLHSSLTIFIYGFTNPVFKTTLTQLLRGHRAELSADESSSSSKKSQKGAASTGVSVISGSSNNGGALRKPMAPARCDLPESDV